MRHLRTLSFTVLLAGFSGLACATAPAGAEQKPARAGADSVCRNVTTMTGRIQSYCGNAAQWAEFDSRMAQLGKGFSCKPVKGSQPLCLFAEQWKYVQQKNLLRAGTAPGGFFDGARESAMAIEHNEFAAVRQNLIDSNGGRPVLIP
jgi:hypothetical protein